MCGEGEDGKSLYLLNFAVNIKLLLKSVLFKRCIKWQSIYFKV